MCVSEFFCLRDFALLLSTGFSRFQLIFVLFFCQMESEVACGRVELCLQVLCLGCSFFVCFIQQLILIAHKACCFVSLNYFDTVKHLL